MTSDRFDLEAYLSRIECPDVPAPDEDGLRALHHGQFFNISFENFDIQLGRGINLDPERLFDKLVARRRGGYCFELNGLLLMALRALGFQSRPLLARVHLETPPSGRTHQLNLVELEGRSWIIDAGFGAGGLRCPMPLDTDRTEEGVGWGFRLRQQAPWGFMMQTREKEQWKDSYSFDLSHVIPSDIAVGNHYTSTSPHSHFVTSRIASIPHPTGRTSIRDFTLTRIDESGQTTDEIPAGPSYLETLASCFHIELDADYDDLRRLDA